MLSGGMEGESHTFTPSALVVDGPAVSREPVFAAVFLGRAPLERSLRWAEPPLFLCI